MLFLSEVDRVPCFQPGTFPISLKPGTFIEKWHHVLLVPVRFTHVDSPGYLEGASRAIPCIFSLNQEVVFSPDEMEQLLEAEWGRRSEWGFCEIYSVKLALSLKQPLLAPGTYLGTFEGHSFQGLNPGIRNRGKGKVNPALSPKTWNSEELWLQFGVKSEWILLLASSWKISAQPPPLKKIGE